MTYRNAHHTTTGLSSACFRGTPSEQGRKVGIAQAKQKSYHDKKGSLRDIAVGARVMARDGRDKSHWSPGTVLERQGPVSYTERLKNGLVGRKHIDHIRAWGKQSPQLPPPTCSTSVSNKSTRFEVEVHLPSVEQ